MLLFLGTTTTLFGFWAVLATFRAWQFHRMMTQSIAISNVALLINQDLIKKNKAMSESLSAVCGQRVH